MHTDQQIIDAMEKHGGSFVKALAQAARIADPDNLRRIKDAWPEYWFKYSTLVPQNHVAAALLEKHPLAEFTKDE